jgi:uncharacterized membrane protein
MDNKNLGSIVGVIVGLVMWMLSNADAYQTSMNNWLFVVFMILVMGVLGGIIGNIFKPKQKKNAWGGTIDEKSSD